MKIIISDLNKKYKKNQVIHHLNCEIGEHIYGLMGPNGSGKTTFIRCILDLISYQNGKITFIKDNQEVPFHKVQFGYLPQAFQLFKDLTVAEHLDYFLTLKNIDIESNEEEILRVLKLVNMLDYKDKKCGSLSGGMVRRIGIAQALLGHVDILIFDEPTAGLDPDERINFERIIKNLSLNIPIILSTHIIEDVAQLCTHALFLKNGQFIYTGDMKTALHYLDDCVYTCSNNAYQLMKEEHITRQQDSETIRVISKEVLPYSFLEKVTPNMNDLYQYMIHGLYNEKTS